MMGKKHDCFYFLSRGVLHVYVSSIHHISRPYFMQTSFVSTEEGIQALLTINTAETYGSP